MRYPGIGGLKFWNITRLFYAEDEYVLDFWLYKYSKTWHGMKRRQRLVSADDLIDRLQTSLKKKHS